MCLGMPLVRGVGGVQGASSSCAWGEAEELFGARKTESIAARVRAKLARTLAAIQETKHECR